MWLMLEEVTQSISIVQKEKAKFTTLNIVQPELSSTSK